MRPQTVSTRDVLDVLSIGWIDVMDLLAIALNSLFASAAPPKARRTQTRKERAGQDGMALVPREEVSDVVGI